MFFITTCVLFLKRLKLGQLLACYSLCLLSSLSTIKLSEIQKYLLSRQTKSNYHSIYFFLPFRWPRAHNVTMGVYHGAFTICQQTPKIPVGNSNGTAHSTGNFPKKTEIFRRIPLFPFQPEWPENRCTICELPLDPVRLGAFSRLHCRFFKMAASASWQCTVCEAILQSTSESLNRDCTGKQITSFGSQLVVFRSVERPKISSCGCKNRSIIKLSTTEPPKFI